MVQITVIRIPPSHRDVPEEAGWYGRGPRRRTMPSKRENEALRVRFARMSEVNRRIAEISDPDAVLQEIVHGARPLTAARYGAVVVFDGYRQIGEFTTSGIAPEQCRLLRSLPRNWDSLAT